MYNVKLISEGHGKRKIHGNEIMLCCFILRNIINYRSVLESADKCRENWKGEHKKILYEIFYVVTVRMS